MKQYVCSICSYTYDEAKGIPEAGIAPGTRWEDLPADWKCPWCKADKSAFRVKAEENAAPDADVLPTKEFHAQRQLSAMEMSIICSNLARGCEKQYLTEESEGFRKLAEFFKGEADRTQEKDESEISDRIAEELQTGYPYANQAASKGPDRGALRSLVWSEKVTRMLQSLLSRYETEGDRMLENTDVWVCTICGFVYLGDTAPEQCPVCKVPDWKFEKIGRRG